MEKNYDSLSGSMFNLNEHTKEEIDEKLLKMDNKTGVRAKSQDDIIDLISCEITKNVKKKNDINIDIKALQNDH